MSAFEEYKRLSVAAVAAFHSGNHRHAADQYLAATTIAPDKYDMNRWQMAVP
jgi:hypothetical protein